MRQLHFDLLRLMEDDRQGSHGSRRARRYVLAQAAETLPSRADEAQRWQARRAETVLAAAVGRPTRRSRRMGRQRKASLGTLAAVAAAPPVSHKRGDGSPIRT